MPEKIANYQPNEKLTKSFAIIKIIYLGIGAITVPFCIWIILYAPFTYFFSNLGYDFIFNFLEFLGWWYRLILFWAIFIIASFISDVLTNDMIHDSDRMVWVLIILVGAIVSPIVYWFIFTLKTARIRQPN